MQINLCWFFSRKSPQSTYTGLRIMIRPCDPRVAFANSAVRIPLMPFFLGIDGGGTKTRCILGDEKSQLGAGSSSSSKVQRVGEACARDALAAAAHEACVQAGISPRQIARTCAGITGSARPGIAEMMRDLMTSIVGGQVEIVGDVEIAFEDVFGSGTGVVVIAGTGSIAYGRNAKGETARAGGWGYPISDEGSGQWIGSEGVRAALRARDRGQPAGLLEDLTEKLGAKGFEDFIVRLNANPAVDFAPLFPTVLAASDRGDAMATEILTQAGRELAGLAGIVIERLFEGQPISVAIHGGVLSSSQTVKKNFLQELKSRHPRASLLDREVDAARGALERARREFKAATA
jgi:N-acetylglucosamine kinase-like BadF-type ATPase